MKRNLFSKVIAGVGALAMVATMMPAVSMDAQAVAPASASSASATINLTAAATEVRIYDFDELSTGEQQRPYTITEWDGEEGAIGAVDGTPAGTQVEFDPTQDLNLLVTPTTWFEFNGVTGKPSLVPGGTTARYVTGSGKWDAMEPKNNEADVTGRSYILHLPANTAADGDVFEIDVDDPAPIIVEIDVVVGDDVRAHQLNYEPKEDSGDQLMPGTTTTYEVRYVPAGWSAQTSGTLNWAAQNARGRYEIRQGGLNGNWMPIEEAVGTPQIADKTSVYGSEILIRASRSTALSGDFYAYVQRDSKVKDGTERVYNKEDIVDTIDPTKSGGGNGIVLQVGPQDGASVANYGYEWKTGVKDATNYIGVRSINGVLVASEKATATSPAEYGKTWDIDNVVYNHGTDATKAWYWHTTPNAITSNPAEKTDKANLPNFFDYNGVDTAEVQFIISPVNILRAYVYGWALDGGDVNWALNSGLATNRKQAGSERYGDMKKVTIRFGESARKNGTYKFMNGEEITDPVSVRNIYRYSYVFRNKDGYRFDQTVGNVWSYQTLNTEPIEYPHDTMTKPYTAQGTVAEYHLYREYQTVPEEQYLDGVSEGDTIEFMVKIDPLYDATNAQVVAYGYDNRGGQRRTNVVEWDKTTGLCKFTFGNQFPYRFAVVNLKPKSKINLAVVPEADAIFEDTHPENFTVLTNEFYGYTPFFVARERMEGDGNINTCNVANPRFQIFVAAHEEDESLIDLVAFARRQVIGGAPAYYGHSFPTGTTKFRVRFNDTFVNQAQDILNTGNTGLGDDAEYMHGSFDNDRTDDRYGKGPDFKVLVNGKEVTVGADDTFEVNLTEDTRIEVEGIVRKYYVYMPKLAGFNFELEPAIEQQREEYQRAGELDREQGPITATGYDAIDFRASVIEGGEYKFKLNLKDNAANSRPVVKADNSVLTPDADGWYAFEVNSDTYVTVDGITVNNAFKDTQNLPQEEQDAIDWLLANGMTVGDGDGNFMPQSNTRRGDFVLMLYRYYGQPSATGNGGFSDVGASDYYASAIAWGSSKGIVNGYPDGTFRPTNIITRAEVANILCKLCGLNSGTANPFVDVNAGDWYYNAVNRCFAAGIVNGTTQTTFTPNAGIIRAHYALMLYRSHSLLPAK